MASNVICPSCRKTPLSRYNTDAVCAACLRASWSSRIKVPVWLWDCDPIRHALARLDLGAVVAILRGATGLSQTDFANLVDGWSQSTVSLIERHQRDILYDVRELLRFVDAIDMPREALLPLVLGDPDATLEKTDIPELAGDLAVNRRSFTTLAASLAAGAMLPPIHIPRRIEQAHVRYLLSSLERLRSREQAHGGGAIFSESVRMFSRARAMLDESDYTEQTGRQLLTVAADIGNAAGWAAFDQEDQTLARQLYSAASLLADDSGAPDVAAHLYTNLAQQSTELAASTRRRGLAREALRFADRATEVSRYEPSPKLHALIATRKAHAHAELGDEHAFRRAITTARHELDRGPHPSDPDWTGWFTHSSITVNEAKGYEALARVRDERNDRASALYRDAIDDPDRSPREQTDNRSRLSRALLDEGDRTQAIAEAESLLPDLGERIVSARALNRLRPVRDAADKTAAEEFCARFDAAERALGATPPPTP